MNEEDELHSLKFDAGKSIRYHSVLRAWWLKLDHWNKIMTLFLGTSAATSAIGHAHRLVVFAGLATALSSSLELVFGFSDKSRVYDSLYRRWSDFLIRLETIKIKELNEDRIIELRVCRLSIERDEPDVVEFIEKQCSYKESIATGVKPNKEWKIGRFSILLYKIMS